MDEHANFRYVAALVTYDGTDFFGFQYQKNHPTIQESLEIALSKFCKYSGRVVGAGRTDTGVHARGQVVAIKVAWRHDLKSLLRAWNIHLPASILIRSICDVTDEFHPRFSAKSRTYSYLILNNMAPEQIAIQRSPLTDRTSYYVATPLDVEVMYQASRCLLGIHDFAAFGRPTQGESTVREITEINCRTISDSALDVTTSQQILISVSGNAFLRHMIRNVVGTLLLVGSHKLKPEAVKEILESRQRDRCAPPVPPHGLVLEEIEYPAECGINF